jgi:U32 family peptidase
MWDKKGNPIEAALGSGWTAQIINPFKDIDHEMLQFALVMKNVKQPIFS